MSLKFQDVSCFVLVHIDCGNCIFFCCYARNIISLFIFVCGLFWQSILYVSAEKLCTLVIF